MSFMNEQQNKSFSQGTATPATGKGKRQRIAVDNIIRSPTRSVTRSKFPSHYSIVQFDLIVSLYIIRTSCSGNPCIILLGSERYY